MAPESHFIGDCKDCGRPMVNKLAYTRVPKYKAEGYVCFCAHGLCNACDSRRRRSEK